MLLKRSSTVDSVTSVSVSNEGKVTEIASGRNPLFRY